jgi:hypothetical protein
MGFFPDEPGFRNGVQGKWAGLEPRGWERLFSSLLTTVTPARNQDLNNQGAGSHIIANGEIESS